MMDWKSLNAEMSEKERVNLTASVDQINRFFKSKKVDELMDRYIANQRKKHNKTTLQIETDLVIELFQILILSAVESKNVFLLDIIYSMYIQFPNFMIKLPDSSNVKHIHKRQSKKRHSKGSRRANKSKGSRRANKSKGSRRVQKYILGGGKLVVRDGMVVDVDKSGIRAMDEYVNTIDDMDMIIIRNNEQIKVNKHHLQEGDMIVERIQAKLLPEMADILMRPVCGGGGSCNDKDVIEYAKSNNIPTEIALVILSGDENMLDTVKQMLKESLLQKMKNESQRIKLQGERLVLEAKRIQLEEERINNELASVNLASENKLKGLQIINDLLKSKNLTWAEVWQCGLEAIFDASYYAVLTKMSILLGKESIKYGANTMVDSFNKLKNTSDTVSQGAEFVVKAVEVADDAGGVLFWSLKEVLGYVEYIGSGDILNMFSDVERAGNQWTQSDNIETNIPSESAPFSREGRIIPERTVPVIPSFNINQFKERWERFWSNVDFREEIQKQILIELTSWPAIVFYFTFIYYLYRRIQRQQRHKSVLYTTAAQGAAAGIIDADLTAREYAVDEMANVETLGTVIDAGVSILTGSSVRLPRRRADLQTPIESPLGGGAVSSRVAAVIAERNRNPNISPPELIRRISRQNPNIMEYLLDSGIELPPIEQGPMVNMPPPPPPPAGLLMPPEIQPAPASSSNTSNK